MYCYYCGNLLNEDELFCPKCGKETKEIHINLDHYKFYDEYISKKSDEAPKGEIPPEVKLVPEIEVKEETPKKEVKTVDTNNENQSMNSNNSAPKKSAQKVVVKVKSKKK